MFKTWMCKHYLNGFCRYGDKCKFAHGRRELREKPTKSEKSFVILSQDDFQPFQDSLPKSSGVSTPGAADR